MLITRWQAKLVPEPKQIRLMLQAEGHLPFEDKLPQGAKPLEIRQPFDEVRMVAAGELLLDIAGNKLLLRPGDRIIVPANTKYSLSAQGEQDCICICAQKI